MPAKKTKVRKWLTASEILQLRALRAKGMKLKPLADRFGISVGAASRIVNRERRVAA